MEKLDSYLYEIDLTRIDFIALSAYVWNEYLINDFIRHLRLRGFKGHMVLGGYQVTYSGKEELPLIYPDVRFFVAGYAEQSLKELFSVRDPNEMPYFLDATVDFQTLPSPYLTGEIKVPEGAAMLRLETKRGCPYKCSFCAHRDLQMSRVYKHPLEKVYNEIALITEKKVNRVNILDPVFNAGKDHLEIMKEINRVNTGTQFTLQSRFENIKGGMGKEFMDLYGSGNYHLEFGLQTAIGSEIEAIGRKNNMAQVEEAFGLLRSYTASYEVSMIYGLPGQTADSFKKSIDYVRDKGCTDIKAYPLMLLRGTSLYEQKAKWNMREEVIGDFNIPVVVSSSSFDRDDWDKMNDIATNLLPHGRI